MQSRGQAVFEIGSEGVERKGEKGAMLGVEADRHLRSAVQGKRSAKQGHTGYLFDTSDLPCQTTDRMTDLKTDRQMDRLTRLTDR